MKKLIIAIMVSVLALAVQAAPYVEDFESSPTINNGFGSVQGTITDGTTSFVYGGSSLTSVLTEGTNEFFRMSRNFATTQSLALGQLITLSDAGLSTGQAYTFSYDYRIGLVGTEDYDAVSLRFAAFEDDGGYTAFNNLANSLVDVTPNGSHGQTLLENYSDNTAEDIAAGEVSSWTTVSFDNSFTFSDPTIGWSIGVMGVGNDGNWNGTDYTYIDIDNVTITAIPEPSTAGLLGLGALAAVMSHFVRRGRR